MNDKLKLLEQAVRKAENDSSFIAYFINKYNTFEKTTEQEIISNLNCSLEDYYKLNLCRVPDADANDFIERLNKISQYTNTSMLELNKIIKRVSSILKFAEPADYGNHSAFLMAARDKQKNKELDDK